MKELTRVASSMFVAVFEALFHVRLEGIIRSPKTKEDYEYNVQLVIDGLGQHISMNLQHIPGQAIVNGDYSALSNLVHIFVHFCPSIPNEDNGGVKRPLEMMGAGAGNEVGGSGSDIDSISTKESTFEENFGGNNQQRPSSAPARGRQTVENQMLTMSSDMVQKLCEEDARQLLLSTEAQIFQEERIEAARRRREDRKFKQEKRLNAENKRKMTVTREMQQKRWNETAEREKEAFAQRQASEEHAMLRQIYTGLLNKLHTWRRSERQEAKERVCRMRDEARTHIQNLQNLFEDRTKLLNEQNKKTRQDEAVQERSHRRMSVDLLNSFGGRAKHTLETHRSLLMQKRQSQLLKRREAHRNLLSLLSVESWQDNLRNNVAATIEPTSVSVSGTGPSNFVKGRDFVF
jgi:hypothetical protein